MTDYYVYALWLQMNSLRKCESADLEEISSWPLSKQDLLFWANFMDPTSNLEQKMKEWHSEPSVHPFVLASHMNLMGYGEIWVEAHEVELARLLVKPELRGQGWGKILLNELLSVAHSYERKVWLRVHPDNHQAKSLYLRNGFAVASQLLQNEFNQKQATQFVWMEAVI